MKLKVISYKNLFGKNDIRVVDTIPIVKDEVNYMTIEQVEEIGFHYIDEWIEEIDV